MEAQIFQIIVMWSVEKLKCKVQKMKMERAKQGKYKNKTYKNIFHNNQIKKQVCEFLPTMMQQKMTFYVGSKCDQKVNLWEAPLQLNCFFWGNVKSLLANSDLSLLDELEERVDMLTIVVIIP